MFRSFFPNPKWFFLSALLWFCINIALWYSGGKSWGTYIGFPMGYAEAELAVDVSRFWSARFLWFYLWFAVSVTIFASFWRVKAKHPWQKWSVWGSALILFNVWFNVQANVAINAWYGPFWDMIQAMLTNKGGEIGALYQGAITFLFIAMLNITIAVLNLFFMSHYIFRWRTAMNDFYTENWSILRRVEGASQRVQEDTMRFAKTMEALAVEFIKAILTLIAFLPLLIQLSAHVPVLPLIGEIKYSLVWAAIGWAIFGTVLLMVVGIKLPGLEFNNQKVEAALRKELVYGEDHDDRAQPEKLTSLYSDLRKNYFRLYFHYVYFNVVSNWYLQLDVLFGLIMLFPSISAGLITLGLINQISYVFGKIRESLQFLVSSWSTIIELLSIYKRLKAFESILHNK